MKSALYFGWLAKMLTILLSIVNIRLLADLSGMEGFAAYSIVFSLTVWVALLNFGVPMGTQKLISEWRAKGLSLEKLRDTAATLVVYASVLLAPLIMAVALFAKFYLLASYAFVSFWAVAITLYLILLSVLGGMFNQILHAEHRSVWPNFYPAAVTMVTSLLYLVMKFVGEISFDFVLSLSFIPGAMLVFVSAIKLKLPSNLRIDLDCLKSIYKISKGYFLVALFSSLTLGIDYVILSKVVAYMDIAAYNFASRLFLVIITLYTIVLTTSWTPMSDMFFRSEHRELRRFIKKLLLAGLVAGCLLGMAVLCQLQKLTLLVGGPSAPTISMVQAVFWLCYILIRIWSDTFTTVLQSAGKTELLLRYIPFQAVIGGIGQLGFGSVYGVEGVLVGIILSFLLTCVWYLPWETYKLLSSK